MAANPEQKRRQQAALRRAVAILRDGELDPNDAERWRVAYATARAEQDERR